LSGGPGELAGDAAQGDDERLFVGNVGAGLPAGLRMGHRPGPWLLVCRERPPCRSGRPRSVELRTGGTKGRIMSAAVLALGGAFNPVHTQHIALMSLVKQVVEAEHDYTISAGYLAVAPDGYVRAKLKDQAMKAEHRLAMCNLAMHGHDWLLPCDRPH